MLNTKARQISINEARFNPVFSTNPEEELLKRAEELLHAGQYDVCYRFLQSVKTLLKDAKNVNAMLARLYRSWVPRWHFSMLNDQARLNAFSAAIAKLNLKNKVVLDIGAGTGLLSMLAAQQNVKHVYACEAVAPIAATASRIVKTNGFNDKITIIPKMSTDLKVGYDLPEVADVLISETIDCGFVGEGFLSALHHARQHLLRPAPLLLPQQFVLKGRLLESDDIFNLNSVGNTLGFDVSDFNQFASKGYFPVRLNTWEHQFRSEVHTLVDVDLYQHDFKKIEKEIRIKANVSGKIHGLIFWFEVALSPEITITNNPIFTKSHWMQAFTCFDAPRTVKQGQELVISFTLENELIEISVKN